MRMNFRPVYHFSAIGAGMVPNLCIHPLPHTDFFHEQQILNNILVMYNAVFNVYGNEILKALAGEVMAFIAPRYALFLCAFPESMTAIHAYCRHSAGKAPFALLGECRACAAEKTTDSSQIR